MFGLLKAKNPYEQEAAMVYAAILQHIRNPAFYKRCSVSDTFDGRFDLLVVHLFMIMHVVENQEFNQALFDVAFADMDQTLREMGVGDIGVPKHMRRMMKGFNGRVHAYKAALEGQEDMGEALVRNLYGTSQKPDQKAVRAMKNYIQTSVDHIKRQAVSEVMAGNITFDDV